MNNENNNQNNDNIVQPQLVDLTKVNVTNDDNLLNRERDNIVSATIQANSAVDEQKAIDVNDQIHIEQGFTKNKKITIGLIIAIVLVASLAIGVLISKVMNSDDSTTTKPIITGAITSFKDRILDGSKVRRVENDSYVMLLLPSKYNKYMLLEKTTGTYTTGVLSIDNDIKITDGAGTETTLSIAENKLVYNGNMLSYSDGEYKYYMNDSVILLINATMGQEKALYINNGQEVLDSFVESDTAITLNNGTVFTKNGTDLTIDGITLKMGE